MKRRRWPGAIIVRRDMDLLPPAISATCSMPRALHHPRRPTHLEKSRASGFVQNVWQAGGHRSRPRNGAGRRAGFAGRARRRRRARANRQMMLASAEVGEGVPSPTEGCSEQTACGACNPCSNDLKRMPGGCLDTRIARPSLSHEPFVARAPCASGFLISTNVRKPRGCPMLTAITPAPGRRSHCSLEAADRGRRKSPGCAKGRTQNSPMRSSTSPSAAVGPD